MTSLCSGCRCRTAAGLNRGTVRTAGVVPVASAIARAIGFFIPPNPRETMDPKNQNALDGGTIDLHEATARASLTQEEMELSRQGRGGELLGRYGLLDDADDTEVTSDADDVDADGAEADEGA